MTIRVLFSLTYDFSYHRPAAGRMFDKFLACGVTGYIRLV